MTKRWTSFDELVATIRRRWDQGAYLKSYAAGTAWEPVTLPVKGPTSADLLDAFEEVVRWAQRFRTDSQTGSGRPRVTVEYRRVTHRYLGANEVPARIRIETFERLCSLLGTAHAVATLDAMLAETVATTPALVDWVRDHPNLALEHHDRWSVLLATVNWISGHDTARMYLRHIDVVGVDTKFVERERKILGRLLASTLPPGRIDLERADFTRRYGFRAKPSYTRLRLLSPLPMIPSTITELRLRTDELAATPLPVGTVFVVENETTYLAFPRVRDSVVVFGEGFGLATLESVPWLDDKEIVYWGDIDTHGFAILNRLRVRFPSVHSILMDHETLFAHADQHVCEPTPTREPLPDLTEAEQLLYQDLIEDRFGPAVRLEQERVRFSLVRRALEP